MNNPETLPELQTRVIHLYGRLRDAYIFCEQQADLARDSGDFSQEQYYLDLYYKYWNYHNRARALVWRLQDAKTFGMPSIYRQSSRKSVYKRQQERKVEKRKQFLTKHFYAPWFMSSSLEADYGTYQCDRCQRTFHHSPSFITQAANEVYHCCCGYCTNLIIQRDYNESPYS